MNMTKYSFDFPQSLCKVSNSANPKYPETTTYLARLKIFDSFPSTLRQDNEDKFSLCKAGFKYPGVHDFVQCFHCDVILREWNKNGNAWVDDIKHSPNCTFMLIFKVNQFAESVC